MTFFNTVTKTGDATAAACVLALPLWLLGVPGVENQYARGWKRGLCVLLWFPPAWLCVRATGALAQDKRGGEVAAGALGVALLGLAALRMLQAVKTMRDD